MQNLMPPVDTPDNLFHDGDPTQGLEGTVVEAQWLNDSQGATRDVQQEIINVLIANGITPDPANKSQLLLALQWMISGDIADSMEGALKIASRLAEIRTDGTDAQTEARTNIGCGTAATHNAEDFMSSDYTPPAAPVISVNGETGAVELSAADVGAYSAMESDARYEPIDSAYTKTESDARYLQYANGVQAIRFGVNQWLQRTTGHDENSDQQAPYGCAQTGITTQASDGTEDSVTGIYYQSVEMLINGVWQAIGEAVLATGEQWVEVLPTLQPDTVKILYMEDGVICGVSKNAAALFPYHHYVAEIAAESFPADFKLGSNNWIFDGSAVVQRPPTQQELTAAAECQKKRLSQKATAVIEPLQDALDTGEATGEQKKALLEWKKYRLALSKVDTSNPDEIIWPEQPGDTA